MSTLGYSDIYTICVEIADFAQLKVCWLDDTGCLFKMNKRLKHQLGYLEADVFPSENIFELIPSLTFSAWQEIWQELQTNQTTSFPADFVTHTGAVYLTLVHAKLFDIMGKPMIFCWLDAPLEAEKWQQLLEMSNFATNHANLMVYRLDVKGSFLIFNEIMLQKLGYEEEELKKMHVSELFPQNAIQDFEDTWEELQQGKAIHGEANIFGKNGIPFPVEYFVAPMSKDTQDGFCAILTDISHRKKEEAELQQAFRKIEELKEQLETENQVLQEDIKLEYNFNSIIATSAAYRKVLKQVEQVADTDAPVLILGEIGTGKELLARALHQLSSRADRPLVKINCSALPTNSLEAELFGYEKGAFFGAYQQKKGRLEMAHQGTIFLDEIAELPLDMQAKLLRVMIEGEFEWMGGTETVQVDVRVVAATSRNLEQLTREGKFRQDLFYRLQVFPIYNLSLRERREDIPLLVRHFVEKYAYKMGKPITSIPQRALEWLMKYDFPGNIRELENIIERAVILSTSNSLHLEEPLVAPLPPPTVTLASFKNMEQMQREHILDALRLSGGQISGETGAAKLLEMNDKTLFSKMKKLGIDRQDYLLEHK